MACRSKYALAISGSSYEALWNTDSIHRQREMMTNKKSSKTREKKLVLPEADAVCNVAYTSGNSRGKRSEWSASVCIDMHAA